MKNVVLLSVFVFLLCACQDDDVSLLEPISDCQFVEQANTTDGRLDEMERNTINDCRDNKLETNEEITANLIGEWELVGFGDAAFSNITQPCGYMVITDEQLIFEFHSEYTDILSKYSWEVENQLLKVDPPNRHLSMTLFCDQFMHGIFSEFGTFVTDSDQYIYEKVK